MSNTPFMIAITGGSGSGKTTLAKELFARLSPVRCTLMGEDNYYLPRAQQADGAEHWTQEEVEAHINFDDTRSKDMDALFLDVRRLKEGHLIDQPVYSYVRHDREPGQTERIVPSEVVIIEGIHVLSEPRFKDLFDLTIFVDTPDDLRLARRIRRDTQPVADGGRGRDVDGVIRQYMTFVRATHYRCTYPAKYIADLVIADDGIPAIGATAPGNDAKERLVAPVLDWLTRRGIEV